VSGDEEWRGRHPLEYGPKYVVKTCSVIDLPLSLVADTVTLPYAIWWTLYKKDTMPPQKPKPEENLEELESDVPPPIK
jgi:hypothetical protein